MIFSKGHLNSRLKTTTTSFGNTIVFWLYNIPFKVPTTPGLHGSICPKQGRHGIFDAVVGAFAKAIFAPADCTGFQFFGGSGVHRHMHAYNIHILSIDLSIYLYIYIHIHIDICIYAHVYVARGSNNYIYINM